MSFQFHCPHCHRVLEGDPAQASRLFHCPNCGNPFLVPTPPGAESGGGSPTVPRGGDPGTPAAGAPPHHAITGPGQLPQRPATSGSPAPLAESFPQVEPRVQGNPFVPSGPRMYHIPCPHCADHALLETPAEMLEQRAICPYCGGQLYLREQDSEEYKRQRQEERERKERKAGKAWLHLAIVLVVLTFIGLVCLFVVASSP